MYLHNEALAMLRGLATPGRPGKQAQASPFWNIVRFGAAKAADLLLPPLCLSCRSAILGHGGLCAKCWASVNFIESPVCDRLGIPLPYATDEPIVSAAALADPPLYDRARAVARYDEVMRDMVHGLKYRDRQEGLALFGRWLARAGRELFADDTVLMPVPLYRGRLWSRRFNQSAMLAKAVSAETGLSANPFCLKRTRRTASQVGLSAEQRRRNVAGAFEVPENRRGDVEGKEVILVDDVITTGATANACARILKRAGAKRVDVLALARVVDPLAPTL